MQEIEAKFYVKNFKKIEERLQQLKARLIQPHTREINIRFDTPDHDLTRARRVLRLRRDDAARLTYKSPSKRKNGIASREEIEFVVEDFEQARLFLEALGYQKTVLYEKIRATYQLERAHIMLDKMPYGNFVEIEAPSEKIILFAANKLGLARDAAIDLSYIALFEHIRAAKKLTFTDISFRNFKGIKVTESDLSITPAF